MAKTSEKSCGCSNTDAVNNKNKKYFRYRVQLGVFRSYNNAMDFQMQLMVNGLMGDIDKRGDQFSVSIGEFSELEDAVMLERYLRFRGFNTKITAEE